MKKRILVVGIIPALVMAFSFPVLLFADQVEHHGLLVEADGTSHECMSCHDGSVGHTVSFCSVKCELRSSHSILKKYPPSRKRSEYAPAAEVISKGIKLQNGRVTCISCHNLRNPDKGHLVRDNTMSNLCRICHIRK